MQKASLKKLVVRNTRSQKFLSATGRWTRKIEAAFLFPNLVNAIHTCLGRGLKDVELILRYEGDASDRCYPLNVA
jgi:hypothetical protein